MNPNPDYDASDELEYGIAAYAWLLRGVLPTALVRTGLGSRRRVGQIPNVSR